MLGGASAFAINLTPEASFIAALRFLEAVVLIEEPLSWRERRVARKVGDPY